MKGIILNCHMYVKLLPNERIDIIGFTQIKNDITFSFATFEEDRMLS